MKLVAMVILYTALFALIAFLTDRCLRRWKRTADWVRRLRKYWLIPYTLLSLLPLADLLLPDASIKYVLQAAGNIWLGFILYYGLLLAVLLLAGRVVRLFRGKRSKGHPGTILCLSLVLALVIFSYGLAHAQQTRVVSYELALDKPAANGEKDMTLILIADLHLGVNSQPATTERMVELINAERPDAVVIAGDIFSSSSQGLAHPERYAQALRSIESQYGVYAVYGNHDVEEQLLGGFPIEPVSKAIRSQAMEAFFAACGFTTLADESVTLPNGVQLFGRIDGEKAGDGTTDRLAPEELLAGADEGAPILVLQHEPIEFRALAAAGADLALCGHTHAGQAFPGNLIVPFFNENAWGYKAVDGMDTIVTAGVGYYGPPLRVGTDSEVTVIHLNFQ